MSIKAKKAQEKVKIDLDGEQGNVFFLLGSANRYAKQLDLDSEKILEEMRSSDYKNAVLTFEKYFGDYVEMITSSEEIIGWFSEEPSGKELLKESLKRK